MTKVHYVPNLTVGQAVEQLHPLIEGMIEARREDASYDYLSIYLQGEPGVGKSSIPKIIGEKMDYYVQDIRPNTMTPDTAAGTRMQDLDTGMTRWFPPEWMPNEDGTVTVKGRVYKGTILFFDELPSADDRVRKPLFGAFLDRRLNGHAFPDNCIVMAAGNEAETGTVIHEMDNATRSRFLSVRIVADSAEWLEQYATNAGITPTVASTIKNNLQLFCTTEEAIEKDQPIYPNPRSWDHLSRAERAIMRTPEDYLDKNRIAALRTAAHGKIGQAAAEVYMAVFAQVVQMTSLYDLLKANPKDLEKMWPTNTGSLYALTHSMLAYVTDEKTLKEIADLLEHWPRKDKGKARKTDSLPFSEMENMLVEVLATRCRKRKIPTKALQAKLDQTGQDILESGPLIRLDL